MLAIEKIKSGDKVISTDPETMETGEKTVLETYIREVTTLVHITVNGEEIITTVDHPFYVKNQGFIKAGELIVGDELLDVNGNVLLVENFAIELTEKPVKVYNFEVEDFHTYHVGEIGVWVHNANADYNLSETVYRKIGEDDTISFGENEETVKYRRVQGGDGSSNSSQQKITVNENGSISIANKDKNLNISIDNGEHSTYFKNEVRGNEAYTVEFEVPKWFDDLLQENTISQDGYRSNPLNQGGTAPKLTDISTPGRSYELPAPWSEWIEEVATNGKIIERNLRRVRNG